MPRINIYVPNELFEEMRQHNANWSAIFQEAAKAWLGKAEERQLTERELIHLTNNMLFGANRG